MVMNDFIYTKSWYKLFISRWEIAIIIEAGHKELHERHNITNFIKISDNLYFSFPCLSYPSSNPLNTAELECFCKGLRLVSAQIADAVQNKLYLIQLKSILFSDCNIQNDAFTASAIQWASEAFGFTMPPIKV